MRHLSRLLIVLSLLTQTAIAEIPAALEGVWIVDIPTSIARMEDAGLMKAEGIAYMRDKILPAYKRTFQAGQMTNTAASGEYAAAISFVEKQGEHTVTNVSGDIRGKKIEFLLTFVPQDEGAMVMQTENKADGSGLIVWKKQ